MYSSMQRGDGLNLFPRRTVRFTPPLERIFHVLRTFLGEQADGIRDKRGFAVWVSFLVLILWYMGSQNNTIASQKAVILGYEEAMGTQGAIKDGPANANLAQTEAIKVCREALKNERNSVVALRAEIQALEEVATTKKLEVATCDRPEKERIDPAETETSVEKKGIGHVVSKWFWLLTWVFWHIAGIFLCCVLLEVRFPGLHLEEKQWMYLVAVLALGLALQVITTPIAAITSCLLSVGFVHESGREWLDVHGYGGDRKHIYLYVLSGLLAEFLAIVVYLVLVKSMV